MKSHSAQKLLVNCFPAAEKQIKQRLETDAMFRELCADYDNIYQTLQQQQSLPKPPPNLHIEDFQNLLEELEADLVRYFKRGPPPQVTASEKSLNNSTSKDGANQKILRYKRRTKK